MSPIVRIALAAALAVPATAALATPSQADITLVQCSGTQQQRYDPGLKMPPLLGPLPTIAFSAQTTLDTCIATSHPDIASASFEIEGGGPGACTIASFYSELTITWKDDQGDPVGQSLIALNSPADLKPLGQTVVTSYGQVLDGLFEGATALEVLELTPQGDVLTQCLSPQGLTHSSGLVDLALTGL